MCFVDCAGTSTRLIVSSSSSIGSSVVVAVGRIIDIAIDVAIDVLLPVHNCRLLFDAAGTAVSSMILFGCDVGSIVVWNLGSNGDSANTKTNTNTNNRGGGTATVTATVTVTIIDYSGGNIRNVVLVVIIHVHVHIHAHIHVYATIYVALFTRRTTPKRMRYFFSCIFLRHFVP